MLKNSFQRYSSLKACCSLSCIVCLIPKERFNCNVSLQNGNASETAYKPCFINTMLLKSVTKYRVFHKKNVCLMPTTFLILPVYLQKMVECSPYGSQSICVDTKSNNITGQS